MRRLLDGECSYSIAQAESTFPQHVTKIAEREGIDHCNHSTNLRINCIGKKADRSHESH